MKAHSGEERFWRVVEDCLVELHGFTRAEAEARWQDLVRRLRGHPDRGVEEMIYHDEPLYVANDLAGHELDDRAVDGAYRAIQERFWPRRREQLDAAPNAQP